MKKLMMVLGVLALLLPAGSLFAADSWTGEVVEMGCYANGQKGEGHASCAKRCLDNGADMGLLVDGDVVKIDLAKSDEGAISTMKEHAGKNVKITGSVADVDGEKVVTVTGAESAS